MSNTSRTNQYGLNTGAVKLGAGLMGVGMLFASAGAAICAAAFAGALRARINAAEVPPSVVVKTQLKRAKTAAKAGIGAWSSQPGNGVVTMPQASVSSVSG